MPVPGQFDDAESPLAQPPKRSVFQVLPPPAVKATTSNVSSAPGDCATRTATEDAAEAAVDFKARLDDMDSALLASLVQARESAAGIAAAFPEGDQRFASFDTDSEEGDGEESVQGQAAVVEEEEGDDEGSENAGGGRDGGEGEPCVGLLDERMDSGPRAALARAREEYGLDLMGEMEKGGLDLFARIRLVNYARRCVREGDAPSAVVGKLREVLGVGVQDGVLADNALLMPVVEGDVLLTVLEGDELLDDDVDGVAGAVQSCLGLESK